MWNYFVISHKTDNSINDENVDLDKYTKIGDYYYNIEPKNYNVNQVIFYGIPHIWEDRGFINGRSFHNLDDQKTDCSELNDQQCISFKHNWHCKYLSVTKLNLENSCLDTNYGKCVNAEDYLNLATSSNNKYGEYIAIQNTQTGDYFTTQNSDFIEEFTNLTGENNYIKTEEIKTELDQIIEKSSSQDVTCDFSISEFQPTNF